MKKFEKEVAESGSQCVHPRVKTKGKDTTMNKLIITGCTILTAFAVVAMPNKKELAQARSHVEDATTADLKALRSGTIAAKDVAYKHLELARNAKNQAEKYLLFQGAFKLYARCADYDAAAEALAEMDRNIKGIPFEVIAELVDKEMHGIADENAAKVLAKFKVAKSGDKNGNNLLAANKPAKASPAVTPKGNVVADGVVKSQEGGYTWTAFRKNGGLCLTAVSPALSGDVVLPMTVNGVTVRRVADSAFKGSRNLKTLQIPGNIHVGKQAFAQCENLEKVTMKGGEAGWEAFSGCVKLRDLFVGKNVAGLHFRSFGECTALANVVFEEGNVRLNLQAPFEGDHALTSLHLPTRYDGTENWCHGAFGRCNNLTKLTITAGNPYCRAENGLVLSVDGKKLLSVASGLTKIGIPPSVETIAYRATEGCDQLRELVIPDTVKILESQSIYECRALETLIIGSGVEKILAPGIDHPTICGCPRLTVVRFTGNAPSHVDNLIYQNASPALVTYVKPGTKGWNRDGGNGLPSLWPTNDVNGRKIAYLRDGASPVAKTPFDLYGPYGICFQVAPGCEKGAEYVLQKLKDVYLPRAVRYYGNPFEGNPASREYIIKVGRNDGGNGSKYTGSSYGPGTGGWRIGLAKGVDKYEMDLDYLAASVLTVCTDANWGSFVFYVNRLVEGDAKGKDPIPQLKEDIRKGFEKDGEDTGKNKFMRAHAPMWAVLEELREKHPKFILEYCTLKNRRFAEGKLPEKLSLGQMADLLGEVTGENVMELFGKYGVKEK